MRRQILKEVNVDWPRLDSEVFSLKDLISQSVILQVFICFRKDNSMYGMIYRNYLYWFNVIHCYNVVITMYICNEFILQWEEGNRKAMVHCSHRFLLIYFWQFSFDFVFYFFPDFVNAYPKNHLRTTVQYVDVVS